MKWANKLKLLNVADCILLVLALFLFKTRGSFAEGGAETDVGRPACSLLSPPAFASHPFNLMAC